MKNPNRKNAINKSGLATAKPVGRPELFAPFAKGMIKEKVRNGNCVIYTRVSSKEQTQGMSLEVQQKDCERYALKNGFTIMGHFGGTYESAKNDERREFNRMLSFVKKSKEKIAMIIVYSVDRFSRSGANAVYIAGQLRETGVVIYAVTQPADTSTPSGVLQQNIQFIFSEYDNQLRREKCTASMKELLIKGEWCMKAPIGYDTVWVNGTRSIVVNAKGKLIKKAFEWKATENITSEEIVRRLKGKGFATNGARLSEILRNPFYCGILSSGMLDGQVVKGNHEQLISEELFLQVNGILTKNKQGNRMNPTDDHTPLKRFVQCDSCGAYLRAYKSVVNDKYYYKCNTKGCGCNKRAESLHDAYKAMMDSYSLPMHQDMQELIAQQMVATWWEHNKDATVQLQTLQAQKEEIGKKLQRLEERYVEEEIDRDMFTRYRDRFRAEQQEIEQAISAQTNKGVSNPEECIKKAIEYGPKLASLWASADYSGKQKLQFLLFPDGIRYNRKKDACRSPRVNSVFACMAQLVRIIENSKGNDNTEDPDTSAWVSLSAVEG